MQVCPNCGTPPEADATACQYCGQQFKRSWLRRLLGSLTGPPAPPPPAIDTASDESQRLSLFEEWLEYARGRETFVIFESARGSYVQFHLGGDPPWIAEVGTLEWEKLFGTSLPESVIKLLAAKGFQPPQADSEGFGWNYSLEVNDEELGSLPELTEWAFREVYGEDGNYSVKVAGFE